MKVDCNKCGKTLNIPEEKIPPNKKVNVSCPSCKNKITIERPPAEKETAPEEKEELIKVMDPSEFADEELEVLEEGAKRVLICDTAHQEKIAPVLKEMDYQPKTVSSDSEAIGRMKFTQYDLVILAEDFAGSSLKKNNVLKCIQPMPMTTRRKMFVALLGKDFRTMDNMQAFALSVNVVINFKDVDDLTAILKKTISENDAFYKVYKETLVALGKA
ncbi:MAG: zinc-ribbon domain-containing protein [Nitrospinota bacterium]